MKVLIIKVAINDSRILKGIPYIKRPYGNTSKLPIATHIITNAMNQEMKVV
jgi:hypothetical protein